MYWKISGNTRLNCWFKQYIAVLFLEQENAKLIFTLFDTGDTSKYAAGNWHLYFVLHSEVSETFNPKL